MRRRVHRYRTAFGLGVGIVLLLGALPAAAGTPRLDFSNDDLVDAHSVGIMPVTYYQSNVGATLEDDEPWPIGPNCGGPLNDHSVWYRFTSRYDQEVTIKTEGSDFDTVLAVWYGIPFTQVVCSDDVVPGTSWSQVTFTAADGWAYYIQVLGYNSEDGDLEITFDGVNADRCEGKVATIRGTNGNDRLNGTKYRDVIVGLQGDDIIRGGGSDDIICGGGGKDRLFGGNGNDAVYGDQGNDLLIGGRGFDSLYGGADIDKAYYATSPTYVSVDLRIGATTDDGYSNADSLSGFEYVVGSRYDDILWGDRYGNIIWGLAGNDQIFGANGNDILKGGPGNDYLNGGKGTDFALGNTGTDTCVNAEKLVSC